MGLGVSLLIESHTLETPTLVVVACINIGAYLLSIGKNTWRDIYGLSLGSPEAEVLSRVKHK